MTLSYYSVYDSIAKDFAPLFLAKNDDDALRMWRFSQKQHEGKADGFNPDDYELWHVVDFDEGYNSFHHDLHIVEDSSNE